MPRTHKNQRGAALIMTLVAIAIVGVLMAAVGNLVIGHNARARTDQDAAKALNLAEAAMNFQVQRISANLGNTQTAYGSGTGTQTFGLALFSSPTSYTQAPSGPRAYDVDSTMSTTLFPGGVPAGDYCKAWVQHASSAATTLQIYNDSSSSPQYVYGQARINGVTRTVRAKAGSVGIFDTYAVFGLQNLKMTGNTGINLVGNIGTNGTITSGDANMADNGTTGIVLAGDTAVNGTSKSNSVTAPAPTLTNTEEPFPPITEIANDVAKGIKEWSASIPPYQSNISTSNGILNFYDSAPTDTTYYNDNQFATYKDDSTGTSYAFPDDGAIRSGRTLTLVGKPYGANYYLTGLDVKGKMNANTDGGSINLWINSTSLTGDQISGNFSALGNVNNQFRIYYRNIANAANSGKGTFTLTGGGGALNIRAFLYVYDIVPYPTGVKFGDININGNVTISGSVIGYTFNNTINGSVTITLPSNAGAQPGEGILFYGLLSPWQEISPVLAR